MQQESEQTSTIQLSTEFDSQFTKNQNTTHINTCENGGILIDNTCICLNQFSGYRCEILPKLSRFSSSEIISKESKNISDFDSGDLAEKNLNSKLNISTSTFTSTTTQSVTTIEISTTTQTSTTAEVIERTETSITTTSNLNSSPPSNDFPKTITDVAVNSSNNNNTDIYKYVEYDDIQTYRLNRFGNSRLNFARAMPRAIIWPWLGNYFILKCYILTLLNYLIWAKNQRKHYSNST